jgi:hypothetical protein
MLEPLPRSERCPPGLDPLTRSTGAWRPWSAVWTRLRRLLRDPRHQRREDLAKVNPPRDGVVDGEMLVSES